MNAKPVALVTGGRRGIGRGICYALAERGFDIAVNDLEPDPEMDETVRGIQDRGGQAIAVYGDLADLAGHGALITTAVERFQRLDCLVNNAGVSVLSRGDLLDVTTESYDRCLNINLRGTFFLTQRFARHLLANEAGAGQHRSIITISSVNAEAASTDRGEYCIAKTGLSMLTKLFALRLAEAGIGVYEVRPGIIETDMTIPAKAKYERLIADGGVPMPRWGQPDDIGQAVATLATGALPYSVGQALCIDGGLNIGRL